MKKSLLSVYWPLLKAICLIKNKSCQRTVLRHLRKDKQFVTLLQEISENTVRQNIRLSKRDKLRLEKHADIIRALKKQRKVDQAGGFLGVIVPILAAEIFDLITRKDEQS